MRNFSSDGFFKIFTRNELSIAKANIFILHEELATGTWHPRPYHTFFTQDPKLRQIHEANVRDMLVFQAVYQKLYEIFDQVFIFDSYSSRTGKGTHAGFNRLIQFSKRVSSNYSERAYILKCDFRKFFDSIDQQILINLIEEEITDKRLMSLITTIIKSFEKSPGKGIPLGNVTSQLFANIYLNKFDQFVKHTLKAKYYVRYCDDFIILDDSSDKLIDSLQKIKKFCTDNLKLELHPNKLEIRKIHSGIDFLGYVSLPHYRVLRTKTKNRLLKRVNRKNVDSYLGVLKHCRGQKIQKQVHGQLR